jgi:hypothetical protein
LTSDEPVSIQLSGQQWESVLRLLAKQPIETVAPLISEIQRQCQMHELRRRASMPGGRLHLLPEDYGPMADTILGSEGTQ